MTQWFLIALGGAVGSILRYALQGWVQHWTESTFPWGTLTVNVLGCALVGLMAGTAAGPTLIRPEYRMGLMVGLLGGFTTFSTFGLETFLLTNDGQFRSAVANVILSCLLGLAAVWAGYRLAENWFGV